MAQASAPPKDPLAWAADSVDVHLAYNQATIRKEDRTALDALAQKFKEDPTRRVLVEGHCDSRGTANYNMMLDERCAGRSNSTSSGPACRSRRSKRSATARSGPSARRWPTSAGKRTGAPTLSRNSESSVLKPSGMRQECRLSRFCCD